MVVEKNMFNQNTNTGSIQNVFGFGNSVEATDTANGVSSSINQNVFGVAAPSIGFGNSSGNTFTSNPFGSSIGTGTVTSNNHPVFGASTNVFGNPIQTTVSSSLNQPSNFGAQTGNGSQVQTSSMFGVTPTTSSAPIFGNQTVSLPLFGTTSQSTSPSFFGASTVGSTGNQITSAQTSVFGTSTLGSGSGQTPSVFGATTVISGSAQAPSLFGTDTTGSGSTQTSSIFGSTTVGTEYVQAPSFFGITTGSQANQAKSVRTVTAGSGSGQTPSVFGTTVGSGCSQVPRVFGATTVVSGTTHTSPSFGTATVSSDSNQGASAFANTVGSGSGQIPSMFGATTQPLGIKTDSSTGGRETKAFSSQSRASQSSVTATQSESAKLFGKLPTSSTTTGNNLFSKPLVKPSTQATDGLLFGKTKPPDTTGENSVKIEQKNLFGKRSMKSEHGNLFGKTAVYGSGDNPFDRNSAKTNDDNRMGKKSNKTQDENLFKKKDQYKENQGSSSRALFQDNKHESRTSRKRTIRRDPEDVEEKRGRNLFARATAGIFGAVDRNRREITTSKKEDDSRRRKEKEEERKSDSRKWKETSTTLSQSEDTRDDSKRQRIRRMSSVVEDVDSKVVIVAKGIPARYNKVPILRRHFSKYGRVKRLYPNINKNQAIIHFENYESAREAKQKGYSLIPGQPMLQLFWSSHTPQKSLKRSNSSVSSPLDSRKDDGNSPRQERPGRSKWESSDVDDELASMAGTSDIETGEIRELIRPKEVTKKRGDPFRKPHSPKKSTRCASPPQSPVKASKVETVTLNTLFQTITKNIWEKKELLDVRDKLLRQAGSGDKKKSDLATAKAFTGTCPDMCPEKERYDRQETRRLSIYEMIPGTENVPNQAPHIDHTRAVKEYSRSSADQTEPLQHELRPEHVLMNTMTYLLREIVERGEEDRWADWYDFLWNRMRGIRKEITQQQLCNKNVAELIEKFSRYHIYCSHRLCEQDMMVFDSKINDENLTKCLQTLKEMYNDLEKNQMIHCENEVEFRAYMVLMNLNEGDTLREVQELRPEVRQSLEIKFALKVYSAVNSHNYVRFFRLVHQATFLNSCIMHRYFTQVRSRGLLALLKSLGKNNKYPLAHLVKIFGLEDTNEATEFCAYYGLSSKDGYVSNDNREFIESEMSVPPRRSISLIESKLKVPIGEVINGEELPELNLPVPMDSFDKYGKFISKKEIIAEFDVKVKPSSNSQTATATATATATTTTTFTSASSSSDSTQSHLIYSNEAVKGIARELFLEVINEYITDIASGPFIAQQIFLKIGSSILDNMIQNTEITMIRELCEEVIKEETLGRQIALERRLLEEKKRQEKEMNERIDRLSKLLLDEYIDEICKEESNNIANLQYRCVQSKLKSERIERCNQSLSAKILQEVVSDIVDEISSEIHEVNVVQRLEQLNEAENMIKLKRSGVFFQVWKSSYVAQVKLKRAMLAFPCGPSVADSKSQLQSLLPERKGANIYNKTMCIGQHSRLNLESATELEKRNLMLTTKLSLAYLQQRFQLLKTWQPLDITRLIQPELLKIAHKTDNSNRHLSKQVTWKLVMSLPDSVTRSTQTKDICDWLKTKFKKGVIPECNNKYKGELLSLYNTSIDGNKGRQPLQFGFCVQCLNGTLQEEDIEELEDGRILLGTGGMIFVLPIEHGNESDKDDMWLESQLRLARIIQAKPVYPSLPLVIICPTQEAVDREEVLIRLNIHRYIEEEFISDVYLMNVQSSYNGGVNTTELSLSDQLSYSVRWLGRRMSAPPCVKSKALKEFINDVVLEEYFTPVLQDLHTRKHKKCLHQSPDILIDLYNCVLDYLIQVISSSTLSKISWPVPEFSWFHQKSDQPPVHWNTEDHLSYLSNIILSLQLPNFYYQDEQTDSWHQVCQDVWSYVSMVTQEEHGSAKIDLVSRVQRLLMKVKDDFEDTCYLVEGEDNCQPTYVNMPWTDLLQICIDFKLKTLNYFDPLSSDEDNSSELKVYYTQQTYSEFTPPFTWKMALLDTDGEEQMTVDVTFHRAVEKVRTEEIRQKEISRAAEPVVMVTKPNSTELEFSDSIVKRIRKETKESIDFEKYLESVVNDDLTNSIPDFNTSMEYESSSQSPHESLIDRRINEHYKNILENGTISERLFTLQERMESDKIANHLFEQKLEYLLNS